MGQIRRRKTIPFNFGEEHMEYIRQCQHCTYNILEGAVRSGKTIDNVYAFAKELRTTPDRIHLATGSTVANAKLNIGDANGFGLEYIFRGQCRWSKFKGNEALIIKGPYTGYRERIIIFAGGGKADSFKKIRGEINRNCPDTPFPVITGVDENQLTGNPVREIPWETNYNFLPERSINMETWKDLTWTNGRYQVSDEGRVRSIGGKKHCERKIMRTRVNNSGYDLIKLFYNGQHHTWTVHRLVMIAFVGEQEPGMDVNHRNGDKRDNRLSNLEWCSRKENMEHCCMLGLRKDVRKVAAVKDGKVVLTADFSRELAEKLKRIEQTDSTVETVARQIRAKTNTGKPYLGYTYIAI